MSSSKNMDEGSKYKKVSKYLSYLLRHHPEEADLHPDQKGFVSLEKVLQALAESRYSWAEERDIKRLQEMGDRKRFEVKEGKIRALYGHSIDVKVEGKMEPKSELYHGTSRDSVDPILEEGLKPMGRQFVHLCQNKREAVKIGKRHDPKPVILKIKASSAYEEGVEFYDRGDIILAEHIPPKFIEVERPLQEGNRKY